MTRLYLVRHGEVDAEGVFYGHLDLPLTARGRQQAEAAAAHLAGRPLRAVHTSDLSRAAEGALLIAQRHGLTPQPDQAFREMSLGLLEGVPFAEAKRRCPELDSKRYKDMWSYRFPGGGENLQDIVDRAEPALRRVLSTHPDGEVALVAHNSVNRVILGRALGLPLKDVFDFAQDFACINVIEYRVEGGAADPAAFGEAAEPGSAGEGRLPGRVLLLNWTPEAP